MSVANVRVSQILLKRGNTTVSGGFTGTRSELTHDTGPAGLGPHGVRIHDGINAGGTLLASQEWVTDTVANITLGNIDLSEYLYSNSNVQSYLTQFDGNIIPSDNITYSLGTATHQWKDLWVSNNTIYLNSVPITINSSNQLSVNGNVITGDGVGVTDRLVNGNLIAELDSSGTLNMPLLIPTTFTATADTEHYAGPGSLTLDTNISEAWNFIVAFDVGPDGTVATQIGNETPWIGNPGYTNGDEFEFTEVDHGIPGYTFTLQLVSIQNPSMFIWTTNLNASEPPVYPSTISSLGAIKLTSNDNSWAFDTSANITLPQTNMLSSPAPISWPGIIFSDGTFQNTAWNNQLTEIDGGNAFTEPTAELEIDGGGA